MAARKLTAKQEAFIKAYLTNGRNGAEAYRTAYRSKASPEGTRKEAQRLIKHPLIAPRIAALAEKVERQTTLTVERWAKEVASIAFFDPRGIFNEDGSMKPLHLWTPEQAAALAGIEVSELTVGENVIGVLKKVRFVQKSPVLDQIAKHLRLYGASGKEGDGDEVGTATLRIPLSGILGLVGVVTGRREDRAGASASPGRLVLPDSLPA